MVLDIQILKKIPTVRRIIEVAVRIAAFLKNRLCFKEIPPIYNRYRRTFGNITKQMTDVRYRTAEGKGWTKALRNRFLASDTLAFCTKGTLEICIDIQNPLDCVEIVKFRLKCIKNKCRIKVYRHTKNHTKFC